MRNIVPLFLVVAFAIVGCDVQRGRFSTSGDRSQALSPEVGCIDIVSGHGCKPFNTTNSDEQHLLYVVIVCPGVRAQGSSSSSQYDKHDTTLNHTWNTTAGLIAIAVRWDRQADTVSIGKQEFMREHGNLFIVRCEAGGVTTCRQLTGLGSHAGCQEVLQFIRKQLPKDRLVASLTLLK